MINKIKKNNIYLQRASCNDSANSGIISIFNDTSEEAAKVSSTFLAFVLSRAPTQYFRTKYFTKLQLDKSPTVREEYVKALKPLEVIFNCILWNNLDQSNSRVAQTFSFSFFQIGNGKHRK